jgi:hypothetical protein
MAENLIDWLVSVLPAFKLRFLTEKCHIINLRRTTGVRLAVSWAVAPCSLVQVYRRFRGTYCLHHRPVNGDYQSVPDYTALQPSEQPSSCSSPWEPQILQLVSGSEHRSPWINSLMQELDCVQWVASCLITLRRWLTSVICTAAASQRLRSVTALLLIRQRTSRSAF